MYIAWYGQLDLQTMRNVELYHSRQNSKKPWRKSAIVQKSVCVRTPVVIISIEIWWIVTCIVGDWLTISCFNAVDNERGTALKHPVVISLFVLSALFMRLSREKINGVRDSTAVAGNQNIIVMQAATRWFEKNLHQRWIACYSSGVFLK